MPESIILIVEIAIAIGLIFFMKWTMGKYSEKVSFIPYLLIWIILAYANNRTFFTTSPRSFGDTLDYLGRGLLVIDGSLICCQRPFTVPLAYKFLLEKTTLITGFQFLISIFSWTILAYIISRQFKKPLFIYLSFTLILMFSMSTSINQWQKALLSESITFSSFALLLACWILFIQKSNYLNLVLLGLVTIIWNFTRYTNNYTLLMITVSWGVYLFLSRKKTAIIPVLLFFIYLVISIAGIIDSNTSRGWLASLGNVVIQKVLPVEDAREYFIDAGMPVNSAVNKFEKNHLAATDDWRFFRDPELQDFRDWLTKKGMSTYSAYLLSHPEKLVLDPWNEREKLLAGWPPNNTYQPEGFSSPLGPWLNFADVPATSSGLLVFAIFTLCFAVYAWYRNRFFDNRLWIPFLMVLFAIPIFFIVFHSDPNDIERHALLSGIQLRLGVWMILLYTAEKFFTFSKQEKLPHK